MKTALIAGPTGLIGKYLLEALLESSRYEKVIALTRKELPNHPKLVQHKVEFDQLTEHTIEPKVDDVFCCLGTTMAKAGSKENFFKVDFYYPLLLAKASHNLGARQFLLVSALGANKSSSVYYNQVKGKIEQAIQEINFETIHIFRPSLLLGPRTEQRRAEDAAKWFYKTFNFLIPAKYKGIHAQKVARAMLANASREVKGRFIHESASMQQYNEPL